MKVDEAIERALRTGYEEDRELKLAAYILATEYTQLRGKLPRTADGVPVMPGMTIYYTYGPIVVLPLQVGKFQQWRMKEYDTMAFASGMYNGEYQLFYVSDCYSTREAAEAE